MFALVVTYGVPSTLPDQNIERYAILLWTWLVTWTKTNPHRRATLVLNGGATNPQTSMTEAEVMAASLRRIFDREFHEFRRCIQLAYETPTALDLWESMANFRRLLLKERKGNEPIVIFCERHRRHRTAFIARRVLGPEMPFRLVSVGFDHRTYGSRDYFARTAELGSAIASWNIPLFYELVEHPRRMAKIGRHPDGALRAR